MSKICWNKKICLLSSSQLDGPIDFGWSTSPFGNCLILVQSNSVIGLSFKNNTPKNQIQNEVLGQWERRKVIFQKTNTDGIVEKIFLRDIRINISFYGNPFQEKVWKALLRIPFGETTTYSAVAKETGNPKATRAVATAIGQNPIAFLVPCHRVVRKSGDLGGYRWGLKIKKLILSTEKII